MSDPRDETEAGEGEGFSLQTRLFHELRDASVRCPVAVFILGSPRTGSTVLYQAVSFGLGLPYIANLTNEYFPSAPVVGFAIQAGLKGRTRPSYESRYGKTNGPMQPSEGSAIMKAWFGGDHPSQVRSARFRHGQREHCEMTLKAAYGLNQAPLVIKNAWNCFRIEELASLAGAPAFIWVRRDIAEAAKSDLAARYAVQGLPDAWNSATPSNVAALRRLPYWEQVVENQYEFNAAMGKALARYAAGRFVEVWYEQFCADPVNEVSRCAQSLGLRAPPEQLVAQELGGSVRAKAKEGVALKTEDAQRIDAYISANRDRFSDFRFKR